MQTSVKLSFITYIFLVVVVNTLPWMSLWFMTPKCWTKFNFFCKLCTRNPVFCFCYWYFPLELAWGVFFFDLLLRRNKFLFLFLGTNIFNYAFYRVADVVSVDLGWWIFTAKLTCHSRVILPTVITFVIFHNLRLI